MAFRKSTDSCAMIGNDAWLAYFLASLKWGIWTCLSAVENPVTTVVTISGASRGLRYRIKKIVLAIERTVRVHASPMIPVDSPSWPKSMLLLSPNMLTATHKISFMGLSILANVMLSVNWRGGRSHLIIMNVIKILIIAYSCYCLSFSEVNL